MRRTFRRTLPGPPHSGVPDPRIRPSRAPRGAPAPPVSSLRTQVALSGVSTGGRQSLEPGVSWVSVATSLTSTRTTVSSLHGECGQCPRTHTDPATGPPRVARGTGAWFRASAALGDEARGDEGGGAV